MSIFFRKLLIFKKCRIIFIAVIIQMIAAGFATSVSEETRMVILRQFDITENAIQQFLNLFTDDNAGHKLLLKDSAGEDESDQTATSPENQSTERLFSTSLTVSSAKNAKCRISLLDLSNFQDKINNILSKVVKRKSPGKQICDVSAIYFLRSTEYKNCKELAELIQCGVRQVKNGFSKADNDEAFKWKYAYQNMSGFIETALDETKRSYHYEEKIGIVRKENQNLENAFYRMELKEDEDEKEKITYANCIPKKLSKYCPVKSWNEFQNDIKRFLKICDFVLELISHIRNGEIDDALKSFEKVRDPDWRYYAIFEEVIAILYKEEGENNLENILKFISRVPWYGHRSFFITKLFDEMNDHNDLSCSRLSKVLPFINTIYEGYTYIRIGGTRKGYEEEVKTIRSTKVLADELYEENCNTSDE